MSVVGSTLSEPFTPRGVAAFARTRFLRLLIVQAVVALLCAFSIASFINDSCFPTIRDAIPNLPDTGKISGGSLQWPGTSPQMLAEGKFLAFDVDLEHSGQIHSTTADVQIEFGKDSIWFYSIAGYSEIFYPLDRFAPFNRKQLEPLWNAWAAEILFLAALISLLGLALSWWILATLYFLPVWILGFYLNRDLNFRASWKLSGASLMPGALLMSAGILLYDFGFLNLISFIFIFAAHFVLGWIYLVTSLFFLPKISGPKQPKNPFELGK